MKSCCIKAFPLASYYNSRYSHNKKLPQKRELIICANFFHVGFSGLGFTICLTSPGFNVRPVCLLGQALIGCWF